MKMELVYTLKAREELQNIKLDLVDTLSRFYSEQTAGKVLSKLTETVRTGLHENFIWKTRNRRIEP